MANFSSKAGYQKWLAYGHMNGDFAKTPGNTPVSIKGQPHSVNHKKQVAMQKRAYGR